MASKENRVATVDMTRRTKDNSVGGNDAGNQDSSTSLQFLPRARNVMLVCGPCVRFWRA